MCDLIAASESERVDESFLPAEGEPDSVLRLRKQLERADGILFASPEYNYNVTPAMKNALDWPSKNPNAYENKPAAVIGAGISHHTFSTSALTHSWLSK